MVTVKQRSLAHTSLGSDECQGCPVDVTRLPLRRRLSTSVASPPPHTGTQSNHGETSVKSKLEDILQVSWIVFLKTANIKMRKS